MNQDQYDTVKLAAFKDELQKIAGYKTETLGAMNPLYLPANAPGAVIGSLVAFFGDPSATAASIKAGDKHTLQNVFVPGVAGYRAGRRGTYNSVVRPA